MFISCVETHSRDIAYLRSYRWYWQKNCNINSWTCWSTDRGKRRPINRSQLRQPVNAISFIIPSLDCPINTSNMRPCCFFNENERKGCCPLLVQACTRCESGHTSPPPQALSRISLFTYGAWVVMPQTARTHVRSLMRTPMGPFVTMEVTGSTPNMDWPTGSSARPLTGRINASKQATLLACWMGLWSRFNHLSLPSPSFAFYSRMSIESLHSHSLILYLLPFSG